MTYLQTFQNKKKSVSSAWLQF